ncbi:DUF3987 domain-containing protein, partial [Pseudomonas sp. FSL R10-0071]|uniref:DUF3987 domain-containing protein n=1 Tax=Pseudomonas sp. FSL R10-0071 TaxID=2662193 RepID=UPI001297F33D
RALDAKARERYSQAQAEHKAACELYDMKRNAARVKARKLYSGGDENAAQEELKRHSSENPPPIQRRYIVNDATVEKLGELLNENPNGLAVERDELGGWLATMQSEDGSVARAFYLECFDGNGSFTYDRIGRGTIYIKSCCLSLIGGIQPSR